MSLPHVVNEFRRLVSEGDSEGSSLYILDCTRNVASRKDSFVLKGLSKEIPVGWRSKGQWPLALAWLAYRTADEMLLAEALSYANENELPVFRGVLAWFRDDFEDTIRYSQIALSLHLDPLEHSVAAYHLACGAATMLWENWEQLFMSAIESSSGRDRGIVRAGYATFLHNSRRENEARSEYVKALREVDGDVFWMTSLWSSIGNSCTRINQYDAALKAFNNALRLLKNTDAAQLSMLFTSLGAIYRDLGQYGRSLHAFSEAVKVAEFPELRLRPMCSMVRTLALMDRRDEALEKAYEAAAHMRVLELGSHPVLLHVALARLLIQDLVGAEEALSRVNSVQRGDVFFFLCLHSELSRQRGDLQSAQDMINQADLSHFGRWQDMGRLFPEVYAMRGVVIPPHPEWQVRVKLNGPVRVWMGQEELPLRSTRPVAGLLALLVFCGGQVSRERALDALDLPGKTPDARRKALSAAVAELREVLGWPGSVVVEGGLLRLSAEPKWLEPELPPPGREDFFCEGRFDPWVTDWRSEGLMLR